MVLTEPKIIFLYVDGVLNDHIQHGNMYCGIVPHCAGELNRILDAVPEAQIVLSSAWRYDGNGGLLTPKAIEGMFQTHGIKCHGRIRGTTVSDEAIWGHGRNFEFMALHGKNCRIRQIRQYLFGDADNCFGASEDDVFPYVVIDDLDMTTAFGNRMILTNGKLGLTPPMTDLAIVLLGGG